MKEIPTAEEFLNYYKFKAGEHIGNSDFDVMAKYAKDFAKLHVAEALKQATEKANLKVQYGYGLHNNPATIDFQIKEKFASNIPGHGDCSYNIVTVNEVSILNAYPLENIK